AINAALHASSEVPLSSRSLGPPPARQTPAAPPLTCNLSREAYLRAVERAREYIAAGDIFQVNLSRRFTVALDPGTRARAVTFSRPACGARPSEAGPDLPLADLYLGLRQMNPAPYAAFLGLGAGRAVLSTSPELFLDSRGGRIVTRPIKGTRPRRPGDETFNERMREDLLASEKDRAELVMIVDLERNDLGRVSAYGTVRVTEPRTVEAYAAVYHTVATVEGRLQPGRDVVDLLKATFPGGSITGAPKVRAMQIIAELEPTRRSVYTGAIGYLGPPSPSEPAGRAALNIAIRTVLATSSAVHLQVGGGVVADSEPEAEFDETTDKARAILAALGLTA
ncbi:MAG: anthranilate synthase component I family protein, partial [Phycisphaerae bacterium]